MGRRQPKNPDALAVGDRLRCTAPEEWLFGQVVTVIGLAVLSCDGFVGVAVQYSARGYSVVRPDELERTNR
jgi:hypothetical protein